MVDVKSAQGTEGKAAGKTWLDHVISLGGVIGLIVGMIAIYTFYATPKESISIVASHMRYETAPALLELTNFLHITHGRNAFMADEPDKKQELMKKLRAVRTGTNSYSDIYIVNEGNLTAKAAVLDWPTDGEAIISPSTGDEIKSVFKRSIPLGEIRPKASVQVQLWTGFHGGGELGYVSYEGGSVQIPETTEVSGRIGKVAALVQSSGWIFGVVALALTGVLGTNLWIATRVFSRRS